MPPMPWRTSAQQGQELSMAAGYAEIVYEALS
jgi:hypothetical protein